MQLRYMYFYYVGSLTSHLFVLPFHAYLWREIQISVVEEIPIKAKATEEKVLKAQVKEAPHKIRRYLQ